MSRYGVAFLGSIVIMAMIFAFFGWVYLIAAALHAGTWVRAVLLIVIPLWFAIFGALSQSFIEEDEDE